MSRAIHTTGIGNDRAFGTNDSRLRCRFHASISSSVLVDPKLTDDRSAATLESNYQIPAIDPVSLALLNAKLPSGRFLIPTPQAKGFYSGSSPSSFHEDQFNTNVDIQLSNRNSLALKFFFANTSQFLALPSFRGTGTNIPGFGTDQTFNNRLISIQDIHSFHPKLTNELRLGYASKQRMEGLERGLVLAKQVLILKHLRPFANCENPRFALLECTPGVRAFTVAHFARKEPKSETKKGTAV
jgi:hypothetical protein